MTVERVSRAAAMKASADGIRWTFEPMVDMARKVRWSSMAESEGRPLLGTLMAAAYVLVIRSEMSVEL